MDQFARKIGHVGDHGGAHRPATTISNTPSVNAEMITEQSALLALCEHIAKHPRIALDTEADSLHCYFEKLCLIQISTPEAHFLVDPLAALDPREVERRVTDTTRDFVYLKRQLAPEAAERVAALQMPGLYQHREYRRFYPGGEVMAHVVGFTSQEDQGLEGIELSFQRDLLGKDGSRRVIKDRLGRVVEDLGEAAPGWGYFAQAGFQAALGEREQYRPGNGVNLNLGVHYDGWGAWTPQLQLNVRRTNRDSGEAAEAVSTGCTLAYLSPGLSWHFRADASLYGFVQLPVYQRVNGVQLTPKATASLGARFAF